MYRNYNFKGQTLPTRKQAPKLSQNKQSHLKMMWELFLESSWYGYVPGNILVVVWWLISSSWRYIPDCIWKHSVLQVASNHMKSFPKMIRELSGGVHKQGGGHISL